MSAEVQIISSLVLNSENAGLSRDQQLPLFSGEDSKLVDDNGQTGNDGLSDRHHIQARTLRISISGYRSAPFG